ncbi:MAG: DUF3568 family protein [Methylotenera sp.]|nr:DUF3568 family protein [Methylotenera sp.]
MRYIYIAGLMFASLSFQGCIPLITSAAGVGGSVAVSNSMNGTTSRTFTASAAKVRVAARRALSRMKIKVLSEDMQAKNNVILFIAKTGERQIHIQIEPISANSTRMEVEAKSSIFFYDHATAEEIILQTNKYLG